MPSPNVEMDDIPDLDDKDDDEGMGERPPAEDNQLEEGNRLFTMAVPCEAKFIRATSKMYSQRHRSIGRYGIMQSNSYQV
jgi:hypothetical protein